MTVKTSPDFELERTILEKADGRSGGPVCGIDEAGRGPWAGPVVAASVILDSDNFPTGLNDSKKLSEKKRNELCQQIIDSSKVGIGIVDVKTIDDINILQASLLAMKISFEKLSIKPGHALVDGKFTPELNIPCQGIIKGDAKSLSIAAASIIAKVSRDKIMQDLANQLPDYGWDKNKGYGTKQHIEALEKHGITDHHRKSFKPIKALL